MARRATLKDVAALAGISTATASRAITDAEMVAPETRARVLAAMKELQYHPNLQARGLRQSASFRIGLIIPDLLNAYYTSMADTILQLLAARHYELLLASTRDDPGSEVEVVHDLIGQAVDGLLWVPTAPDSDLMDFLAGQHIPAVALVRRVPGDVLDTVVFDDYGGSYEATRHLIDLGHRQIGLIGGEIRHSSNRAREQGYLQALADAGLPEPEPGLVHHGAPRAAWASLAAADMLRLSHPPTALFITSNVLVQPVLATLRLQRVAVPGEMSLICFDDVDWFAFVSPPITAIGSSRVRLAEVAVDLLWQRIKWPADQAAKPPTSLAISFEFLLRGSTGPARSRQM